MLDWLNALPGAVAQGMIWGIMAIGVYITYKILDIADLTVDGSMCTGAAVCTMLMLSGVNVWLALLISILAGMLAGFVTGAFHTFLGIPAILAGILTQLILWSVNLVIMGKSNQSLPARSFYVLVTQLKRWETLLILVAFCAVLIAILYWFFGTEFGSAVRATGCNIGMSRAQGINTDFNKIFGLMLSNGIVALSGALMAQYQGAADVSMGRGAIVTGLAAVIIGEAIFSRILRNFAVRLSSVVFGGVIYFIIYQTVVYLGVNTDYLRMLSALVVAVFLAVPYLKAKYFSRKIKRKGDGGSAGT